jgi:hypothetical protein
MLEEKVSYRYPIETETLAATTPGIPDISIHHTPEPKGTFNVLQQKGIKMTSYKEESPK